MYATLIVPSPDGEPIVMHVDINGPQRAFIIGDGSVRIVTDDQPSVVANPGRMRPARRSQFAEPGDGQAMAPAMAAAATGMDAAWQNLTKRHDMGGEHATPAPHTPEPEQREPEQLKTVSPYVCDACGPNIRFQPAADSQGDPTFFHNLDGCTGSVTFELGGHS